MLKLVISDDEGKTTVVPLVRDEITIGRKEGNTIRLTERNVSRRHARIARRSTDYVLEDLASYNGIVVNGARLADARAVRHGDQILIGDYKLSILEEATAQVPLPTPPPPPPSEPVVPLLSATMPLPSMPPVAGSPAAPTLAATPSSPPGLAALNDPFAAPTVQARARDGAALPPGAIPDSIRGLRLVFLAPAGVPAPVMLDHLPMILGRSEAADIALPFSSISREHGRLFLENNQLVIEDLGSSNGIQVNGEKVRRAELGPGDMVQLGVVEFRVARRGDSTVVIQKIAAEEKRASSRSPVPMLLTVLVSGAVLGLALFFAVRPGSLGSAGPSVPTIMGTSPTTPPSVAVETTPSGPVTVQPAVEPTPVLPPTPAVPPTPVAPPTNVAVANPPETAPLQANPTPPAAVPNAVVPAPPSTSPVVQTPTAPVAQTPRSSATRPRHGGGENNPRPANNANSTATNPPTTPAAPATTQSTANTQPSGGSSGEVGIDAARRCLRTGDNACALRALQGHAHTEQELALLATTYRAMGQRDNAIRTMRRYISTYPAGPRVNDFQRFIDSQ